MCKNKREIKNTFGKIVPIDCGQCILCKNKKQRYLSHLIQGDVSYLSKKGIGSSFITLTIEDQHNTHSVYRSDLQKLFKRLRKNSPIPFRYLALGDYGGQTQRPHYHAILIGYPLEHSREMVKRNWHKGFSDTEPVVSRNVNYITRYISKFTRSYRKQFEDLNLEQPFSLRSQGIGQYFFINQFQYIDQYGQYFYKGHLYPLTPYHLAKYFGTTPQAIDFTQVRNQARSAGFTDIPQYLEHQANIQELIAVHRYKNTLKPPQGLGILPTPYQSPSIPHRSKIDVENIFTGVKHENAHVHNSQ